MGGGRSPLPLTERFLERNLQSELEETRILTRNGLAVVRVRLLVALVGNRIRRLRRGAGRQEEVVVIRRGGRVVGARRLRPVVVHVGDALAIQEVEDVGLSRDGGRSDGERIRERQVPFVLIVEAPGGSE